MNEELAFRIGLSGTYWGKKPQFFVTVHHTDGSFVAGMTEEGVVSGQSGDIEYIEFLADIPDGDYELHINFFNKEDSDVVQQDGAIVKDMLLNVESIEIDDIDLGTLRHTASKFVPVKPQVFNGETITELDRCVNLGWNGTYVLPFTTPFHYWLLENL